MHCAAITGKAQSCVSRAGCHTGSSRNPSLSTERPLRVSNTATATSSRVRMPWLRSVASKKARVGPARHNSDVCASPSKDGGRVAGRVLHLVGGEHADQLVSRDVFLLQNAITTGRRPVHRISRGRRLRRSMVPLRLSPNRRWDGTRPSPALRPGSFRSPTTSPYQQDTGTDDHAE